MLPEATWWAKIRSAPTRGTLREAARQDCNEVLVVAVAATTTAAAEAVAVGSSSSRSRNRSSSSSSTAEALVKSSLLKNLRG